MSAPPASSHKSRGGPRRLAAAVRYSLQGLGDACRREAAFRQELALAAVLVPAALLLPFSAVERVLLIGSLLLVLIVELLNSAIEAVVDSVKTRRSDVPGSREYLEFVKEFVARAEAR